VARDRQRAKQRRRRQPGAGGPARTRPPRDESLDPAEGELEATTHAFPDVEEARMAEAGVPVEPPADDDAVEPAADELDPAVTEDRYERRGPRRSRGRIFTFLGHVIDELGRVQWPDRRHVGQGTAVVLGFVVIAGSYLGLMDAIWKPLIEALL
jgi:preprotein translocase subunit SecE